MLKLNRVTVASAAAVLAVMGPLAIATGPTAVAAANSKVTATGGDGTAVDVDGTQGDFTSAIQGTADDDGDQDAFLTNSPAAAPQVTAGKK